MKRPTIKQLQDQVAALSAYQDAFFSLMAGEVPERFASHDEEDPYSVEIVGLARSHGGVIVRICDNATAIYLSDYSARVLGDYVDPYRRQLVSELQKAQARAIKARCETKR